LTFLYLALTVVYAMHAELLSLKRELGNAQTERCRFPLPSEEGTTEDFRLKGKAIIWHLLPYMCRIWP
jgi:hypothetical protein